MVASILILRYCAADVKLFLIESDISDVMRKKKRNGDLCSLRITLAQTSVIVSNSLADTFETFMDQRVARKG